jgi:hypothetical protein
MTANTAGARTFPFSMEAIEAFYTRPDPWIRVGCPKCSQRPFGPCFHLPDVPSARRERRTVLFQEAPHPERLEMLRIERLPALEREAAMCAREVAPFLVSGERLPPPGVFTEWWMRTPIDKRPWTPFADHLPGFKVVGHFRAGGAGALAAHVPLPWPPVIDRHLPLTWPTVDLDHALRALDTWRGQIGHTAFGAGRLLEAALLLPQDWRASDGLVLIHVPSAAQIRRMRSIIKGGGFPQIGEGGAVKPLSGGWLDA